MSDSEFQPQWFGQYELIRRIGMGGMAEVFLARQLKAEGFEKVVVVKRMLGRLARDDNFVQMFLDEARVAVKLRHANIVQILALEKHEGRPFIVMEYVHGKDLFNVIKTARKARIQLPVDFSIYCLAEMLKGLHYAHTAVDTDGSDLNLVHRDVTPSNIFLSYNGEVKLGDFGVAHQAGGDKGSEVRGKFAYLAPEILEGRTIDARADIFSTGVVLWETLAQKRLFTGQNQGEILRQVCKRDPEPPSTHNSNVPFELDVIAIKALEKDPDRRFKSAAEFEEALSDYLFEQRKRWTPRMVADVMKQTFPEDCKPLVLPPPSVPAVMGALVEQEAPTVTGAPIADDIPDETDVMALAMGGLEMTPSQPPGSWIHTESPWPESLESNIFEISDEDRAQFQQIADRVDAQRLKVYRHEKEPPELLTLEQSIRRLTNEPERVIGVGASGSWAIKRRELGQLVYWDTLAGFPDIRVPATFEGYFKNASVTRVLYEMTVRRISGAVLLEQAQGNSRRLLCLEGGFPLYVYSDRPQDGAPALILNNGFLEQSTLFRSLVQVIGDRMPLDQALLAVVGASNKGSIERTFSTIIRSRLYETFWWQDGRYRVYTNFSSPIRLNIRIPPLMGILVRAARKAFSLEELEGHLYGRGLQRVVVAEDRRGHVPWLRLKPDEQKVFEAIDGERSLPQIMTQVGATEPEGMFAALATLYVLSETRIIELF